MSDFFAEYLHILRKQVEDEIIFLVQHDHDVKKPAIACIFCKSYQDENICTRMKELREFQSIIAVRMKQLADSKAIPATDLNEKPLNLSGFPL